jgi:hypothetical protein
VTPKIDNLIARATLLRQVISEIEGMIDQCQDRSEYGPPTLKPVYKSLSLILENDINQAEALAGRLAEYFNLHHDAELSQAQRQEMISFIEYCEAPVVCGLDPMDKIGYVRQISRPNVGMRDC